MHSCLEFFFNVSLFQNGSDYKLFELLSSWSPLILNSLFLSILMNFSLFTIQQPMQWDHTIAFDVCIFSPYHVFTFACLLRHKHVLNKRSYPKLTISLILYKTHEKPKYIFKINFGRNELCWRIKDVSLYDPQAYGPHTFFTTGFPRFLSIRGARGLQAFDQQRHTSY
jgi:hypothetical protein